VSVHGHADEFNHFAHTRGVVRVTVGLTQPVPEAKVYIGQVGRDSLQHKMFGGLDMMRQATVVLASMNPLPYNVNKVAIQREQVDRKRGTFDAAREISS
jgi:hypothetical protein